jgi:hypothetical protein
MAHGIREAERLPALDMHFLYTQQENNSFYP